MRTCQYDEEYLVNYYYIYIQLLHSSYFTLLIFMEKRDQKSLRPLVRHNRKSKFLSESPYNPKDKNELKIIDFVICL